MKYTFKGETNSASSDVARDPSPTLSAISTLTLTSVLAILSQSTCTKSPTRRTRPVRKLPSWMLAATPYALLWRNPRSAPSSLADYRLPSMKRPAASHSLGTISRSPDEMENLNVYMYVYRHWSSTGTTTPQFLVGQTSSLGRLTSGTPAASWFFSSHGETLPSQTNTRMAPTGPPSSSLCFTHCSLARRGARSYALGSTAKSTWEKRRLLLPTWLALRRQSEKTPASTTRSKPPTQQVPPRPPSLKKSLLST